MRRWRVWMAFLPFLSLLLLAAPGDAASAFANPAFQAQWQQGETLAPNFWGPLSNATEGRQELYKEAHGGTRLVQYFDKGRMELTNGVLTNGLLATEMFRGQVQVGDATFQPQAPPAITVAGDPDNPGPTYAGLSTAGAALFVAAASKPVGFTVTTTVDAGGAIIPGGNSVNSATTIAAFDATTQHNVPGSFAQYRDQVGLAAIGYALSEPFLAKVKVAGAGRLVMVQVFERRVLTYTAENPDPYKVEMGNIGQHYYQWRPASGTSSMPSPVPTTAPSTGPGMWTAAASLVTANRATASVPLKDGAVLVIGGNTGGQVAERYDPARNVWSVVTAPPTNHGDGFVATLLADGRVLLLGGTGSACTNSGRCLIALKTTEIYDPVANVWIAAAPMNVQRHDCTVTLLPDGQVLVVGGSTASGTDGTYAATASVERYNPAANTWTTVASLTTLRYGHAATLLNDGTVLVAGGITARGLDSTPALLASAERYDPMTTTWSAAGTMTVPLGAFVWNLAAVRLTDGSVLIAGNTTLERYDPVSNGWSATATMPNPRTRYTATLLASGKVLVAGGAVFMKGDQAVADAALYDPAADRWATTGSMVTPRFSHTATVLADGQVLAVGGEMSDSTMHLSLASAERYHP